LIINGKLIAELKILVWVRKKELQKAKSLMTREIPATWAFVVVIVLLVLFLIFSYSKYLTIPEWMLPNIFFAFMTALFGFLFAIGGLYLRDYLEIGKMKKVQKLNALEALKREYSRCKWAIANSLEMYVEKNQMANFVELSVNVEDVGEIKISEQLQKEIQEYNEKIQDYNIFLKASENHIRNSVETKVKRMFKKTLNRGCELNVTLCSDFFMTKYFNGEIVTCNLLRDTEPIMLKNITKDVDESERYELDVFFKEVNDEFQKEDILLRFRKQREAVIGHGKRIAENLQKEISLIDKEMKKHDYLRVDEQIEESSIYPD
jgi:hypothetical protein